MKPILRALALIFAVVMVFICMNLAAPLIDTQDLRDHAWQGALMLGEQEAKPQMVGGFKSAQLDNYTGVLILKTAAHVGNEPYMQRAFGGLRVDLHTVEGETGWKAYANYEFGELAPDGTLMHYARYWHGYLLPLRILLCVFDLANLQMLLYFAQTMLLAAVLCMMHKRRLTALIPGFFLAFFLMMPMATGVCLQYAPVTLLMLGGCLAVLCMDKGIDRAITLPGFFALLGVVTNYLDLLTFPVLTLLFPLVMMLCLDMKAGKGLDKLLVSAFFCCAAWAVGYGCMWALKWLINCFVYGFGYLENVFTQAALRTSTTAKYTRLDVVMRNMDVILGKKAYLILMMLAAAATLALTIRRGAKLNLRALCLLLPMAVPFMWYIVLANHAYDHTYFTYRTGCAAVFAGYALLAFLIAPRGEETP